MLQPSSRPSARSRARARRLLTGAALALLAPSLAACNTAGEATGSLRPIDYRDRHPIKLADEPRILDVFLEGEAGLSPRSRQDVAEFVAEYRRLGSGPLVAQAPAGAGHGAATGRALAAIRSAAGGRLSVSGYLPADPTVASPIRLTFRKLQAKVASTCGLWPEDLGVSDYEYNASNVQYWNFGCASQSTLASQVADPTDLVRARPATAPDTGRRMYNIEQLRKGTDPTTQYQQQNETVRSGIGQ